MRPCIQIVLAVGCLTLIVSAGRTASAQSAAASSSQSASQTSAAKAPAKQSTTSGDKHQATGLVVSLTDSGIVIAKGRGDKKMNWSFVRNEKTKTTGTLNRNCKVTVYYHEEFGKKIAERIKVLEPPIPAASTLKPPGKSKP